MQSVADALEQVLARTKPLETELVPTARSLDCYLADTVFSPTALPRWDNSAMDGYAVRSAETPGELRIDQHIFAGDAPEQPLREGYAARILTGAPIPPGCDAVEMQENTEAVDGSVRITKKVAAGAHIRRAGEDIAKGAETLPRGTFLGPGEIGVAAALGLSVLPVYRKPVVAILPTGNELVELGEPIKPGQIYNSNSVALASQVSRAGATPKIFAPVKDDPKATREAFEDAMSADLVLSSGGVSVGDKDYVQPALKDIGAEIVFWKVAMKPGKPLLFAQKNDTLFLGLPGNPVSSMITFELFARPALLKMQGQKDVGRVRVSVRLAEPYKKTPGRSHYLPSRIEREGNTLHAHPSKSRSSGMLSAMVGVDGLLEIPAESGPVEAGSMVSAILLRPL